MDIPNKPIGRRHANAIRFIWAQQIDRRPELVTNENLRSHMRGRGQRRNLVMMRMLTVRPPALWATADAEAVIDRANSIWAAGVGGEHVVAVVIADAYTAPGSAGKTEATGYA